MFYIYIFLINLNIFLIIYNNRKKKLNKNQYWITQFKANLSSSY